MPNSKMKRKGSVRIPVTRGLKDIYAMDMHAAYQAACLGQFSVMSFGRLAAALSVVRAALEEHHTTLPHAIETLDKSIAVLLEVRKKGDETEVWEITEDERPSILEGIEMAEECIGTLDVALLERTALKLLESV